MYTKALLKAWQVERMVTISLEDMVALISETMSCKVEISQSRMQCKKGRVGFWMNERDELTTEPYWCVGEVEKVVGVYMYDSPWGPRPTSRFRLREVNDFGGAAMTHLINEANEQLCQELASKVQFDEFVLVRGKREAGILSKLLECEYDEYTDRSEIYLLREELRRVIGDLDSMVTNLRDL